MVMKLFPEFEPAIQFAKTVGEAEYAKLMELHTAFKTGDLSGTGTYYGHQTWDVDASSWPSYLKDGDMFLGEVTGVTYVYVASTNTFCPVSNGGYRGEYSAHEKYIVGQLVTDTDGRLYGCIGANMQLQAGQDITGYSIGCPLDNTTYWALLSIGAGEWVNRAQDALRSELLSENGGDSLSSKYNDDDSVKVLLTEKLDEIRSILDFGAISGASDSSASFSKAARKLPAAMGMTGNKANATRPDTVLVRVPAGVWNILDYVDTNGRDVVWLLDQGAIVNGSNYLQGAVVRAGVRSHKYTFSTMDPATCLSTKVDNQYPEKGAEATGISVDAALSLVIERATLAHYVENRARSVLFTILSPTFSATGLSFSTAIDTRRLRIGMLIDTTHTTKYSGTITGWGSDGKSIVVSGWYLSNGVLSSATTPPSDGSNALVNPITKAWGDNTNVFITADSGCTHVVGEELGVFNNQSNWLPDVNGGSISPTGTEAWGYDSVNLGTYQSRAGFIQRANFHYGLECTPVTAGLYVKGSAGKALYSESTQTVQIRFNPNQSGITYQVDKYGNTEAGSLTTPMSVAYDWHSSGNSVDYDVRMLASGGSATAGSGLLSIYSGGVAFGGQIRPINDNAVACGTALQRWSIIYAASGTINTSDEEQKTWCDDDWLTDAVMDVWEKVPFHAYQWKSSIAEKGATGARIHYGFGAQTIGKLFEDAGIDPNRLALFCYDEWEAKPAVIEIYVYGDIVDNNGNIVINNVEEKDSKSAISQCVDINKQRINKLVTDALTSGNYLLLNEAKKIEETLYRWAKTREEEFIAEPAIEAGGRYGLRYDQCLVLEAATQRRKSQKLSDRLDYVIGLIKNIQESKSGIISTS